MNISKTHERSTNIPKTADRSPETTRKVPSKKRVRRLWYRLRVTMAQMNYASRRVVELQVVNPSSDRSHL